MLFNAAAVLALASSVAAVPQALHKRFLAPVPQVTYPHDGNVAVWVIGYQHNVTWDSTNAGNNTANIYLAKGGVTDTTSPLASNVNLTDGRVVVTVPSVTPASDYTVVLTADGSSSESADFIIADSKSQLPSSAASPSSGATTTVAFPSTTIVSTYGSAASSAASGAVSGVSASASSALSSLSSQASSAASSLSSGASSLGSSASSVASSIASRASSAASSAASSSTSSTGSASAAGRVAFDTPVKALTAIALVAVSAGAMLL